MKAFQYHEYGGPEVLQLIDRPRPEAGPGQVLIAEAHRISAQGHVAGKLVIMGP